MIFNPIRKTSPLARQILQTMSHNMQCNDNALLLSIGKPITRPLVSQVEIAPAIFTIINIIFNYAHSCVSVASWDHTKQRDY